MKYITTRKAVVNQYGNNILCVPYADLQTLLRCENATAYTSGTYGWNADIYDVDGVAICTGYRPFGRDVDRDIIRKYENLAREEVSVPYPRSWKITQGYLRSLLREFVREATAE